MEENKNEEIKTEDKKEIRFSLYDWLLNSALSLLALVFLGLYRVIVGFGVFNAVFRGIMFIMIYGHAISGVIFIYVRKRKPTFEFWFSLIVLGLAFM